MAPNLTKVVYKPDSQSTSEYTVIVNPAELKKWKAGDTTIPLADVVDSFSVFHSAQGAQGLLGKASKQQLDTDFGTHKDTEVVEFMLKNGKEQAGEGPSQPVSRNDNRGSLGANSDTKGYRA